MKSIVVKCECGELLEITNKIVVCNNCLGIYHPVEKTYKYYCTQCDLRYNTLFPICPKCQSEPEWEPNLTKIVITEESESPTKEDRGFIPTKEDRDFIPAEDRGFIPLERKFIRNAHKKTKTFIRNIPRKPKTTEKTVFEPIQPKKGSFLINIILGIFCFSSSGITLLNILEYVLLKKLFKR